MDPISDFLPTPAVQQLETLFGSRWRAMALKDRVAIIAAIAKSLSANLKGLALPPLPEVCKAEGHVFSDSRIAPLLRQLDGEIESGNDYMQLIMGIAESCSSERFTLNPCSIPSPVNWPALTQQAMHLFQQAQQAIEQELQARIQSNSELAQAVSGLKSQLEELEQTHQRYQIETDLLNLLQQQQNSELWALVAKVQTFSTQAADSSSEIPDSPAEPEAEI
ncbi:hypothetical protein [Sphaerothrix gracilis]|uniref:hypothetical protein n=1 Tax=Sphaerothrix gracilis TaxID=3151835 RepID=UPI0031FDF126